MKKYLTTLAVVTLLCGCSSLYTGIVTITQVRDNAMKTLAQLNKAGKISVATFNKIDLADQAFRNSAEVTQAALIAYKNTGDKAAYIKALTTTKAAVSSIIDILIPLIDQKEAITLQTQLTKAVTL